MGQPYNHNACLRTAKELGISISECKRTHHATQEKLKKDEPRTAYEMILEGKIKA